MRTLIFDTETTALIGNSLLADRHQPQIIEFFGHIVNEEAEVVEELEFFCNPGKPLPEEVTRITGIKDEQVRNERPFDHYAGQVALLVQSADTVVAHNLSYDEAVVEAEFKRLVLTINWPDDRVCTVEQTEHLKGHRLSLSALHEELFGEPFTGAHRARVDVEALTRCYLELVRRGEI